MWSILGGLAFVLVAVLVGRPILKWLFRYWIKPDETLSEFGFVVGLCLMAVGAYITDALGLHAVFGAFIVGAIIPKGIMTRDLISRIQPLTVALLLPLFFTFSGLNTRIGLLDSWYLWTLCLWVLIAAIIGKGIACWLAAWWSGIPHRQAMGIGVLMNSRGLMELIIINIGLQRGIISAELFAILVIMAVVTTLMTSPIFDLLVDTPKLGPDSESRLNDGNGEDG